MSEEQQQQMSDEEMNKQLAHLIGTVPTGDDKHSVHKFLHNVAVSPDTTKLGNLSTEELGQLELTERAYKELGLISQDIIGNEFFKEYFEKEAEIVTSTSLSKEAKLLDLAVVQRREIADKTDKAPTENKGWFGSKKKVSQYGS